MDWCEPEAEDGVADGTRTHDDQNHNLGLYQLSYSHRRQSQIIRPARPCGCQRPTEDAGASGRGTPLTSTL